jgi:uncharacterized protein YecT (DUF1311 family)
MKFKIFILSVILQYCFINTQCQTVQDINNLEGANKTCIDSAKNQLHCSREYYFKMDSILKVAYFNLSSSIDNNLRKYLKKEQLGWLKKRDKYFVKQNEEARKNEKRGKAPVEMYMKVLQNDAEFIKERVLELINRIVTKPFQ